MLIGDAESDRVGCLDLGHHPVRHVRSQTARMRKEAYGPTKQLVSLAQRMMFDVDALYFNFQDIIPP